jgi:dTDP-4-dehydrorhamnose reductase
MNNDKLNIAILGSEGMAGHLVYEYLCSLSMYNIFGVSRKKGNHTEKRLDVLNFDKLRQYLIEINPNIVINCIGVLKDVSEKYPMQAILTNSYLPHFLSNYGSESNTKIVHISTDCVFSGKSGNYTEKSICDAFDVYGRSKTLGEISGVNDLTIRTSIIGPELKTDGTGLLGWLLNSENQIYGYRKVFWSGITTLELAKAIHDMITKDVRGLYQLTNNTKISKYDLLVQISNIWGNHVHVLPQDIECSDKSLITTRIDYKYPVPDYHEMNIEMFKWMNSNKSNYAHYFK